VYAGLFIVSNSATNIIIYGLKLPMFSKHLRMLCGINVGEHNVKTLQSGASKLPQKSEKKQYDETKF
jgi:hypothetical protein